MTLNASGPISLGGSTVGQSINLELGNSATALASINSAPFRTLAGVASGAIALSNFYGKSSNSYWALSAGPSVLRRGFAVSLNGVLAICSGQSDNTTGANDIYFFSVDGVLTKTTRVNSYYDYLYGYQPRETYMNAIVNNNSTTDPIFYPLVGQAYYTPYGTAPFNSTANTNLFSSNLWKWGTPSTYDYNYSLMGTLSDTNGNIYLVPENPTTNYGKFTGTQTAVYSYTSTGSARWGFRNSAYYAPDEFATKNYAVVRTDDKIVVVGTAKPTGIAMYVLNASTGAYIQGYTFDRATGSAGYGGVLIDSSNSLYVGSNANANSKPRLFKINSSFAAVAGYEYGPNGGGVGGSGWAASYTIYNGVVYFLTGTSDVNLLQIVALDSSTLLPSWTLSLSFSGGTPNSSASSNGRRIIQACSVGVYVHCFVNSFSTYIKLPLDGAISGTKSITAPSGYTSYSINFNKVTSGASMCTATAITFNFNGTFGLGYNTPNPNAGGSGQTPQTGVTPTTVKTTF
jgi:hypothetical protein